MTIHTRNHGVLAVRASGRAPEVFAELQAAVQDFKTRHEGRVDQIEGSVDRLAMDLAAFKLGAGAGMPLSAGGRQIHKAAAMVNLGDFAKTGDQAALSRGFDIQAAMSAGSNPDGGFTVPEELAESIAHVQRDTSAMRRLARVVTTTSASFDQPVNLGGTGSGWVGETAARPETTSASLANVNIPAGEIYAMPAVTQQLLDDSAYNIGDFITDEIATTFNEQEGAAFIAGNGTNKPLGFLTGTPTSESDTVRAFGTLEYVPTGAAGAISNFDVLMDLVFRLKAKYRQNASWLMNSATMAVVSKMKDGDGNYIWQRAVTAGAPSLLLGYPVVVDEDMPDVAADAFPIAFGDWQRGYFITDRTGVRILRDPYSNKPFVMFYATKRVGGAVVDSNAIKLLKASLS